MKKLWAKIKCFLSNFKKRDFDKNPRHLTQADEDLIVDTKSAFLDKPTLLASGTLYVIIALIVIGLIWSYFGILDQSTICEGKVIPITESKIIQSLDGGTIKTIKANEGDIVNPGQVLLELDTTRYSADYAANYEKYIALAAKIARLTAESKHLDRIDFPEFIIKEKPKLIESETALFDLRRKNYLTEIANLQKIISSAKKEVKMYEPLLKDHYVSDIQYLHALRAAQQAEQDLYEKQHKFEESIWTDLNQNKADAAIIYKSMQSLEDKITDATIRTPVYGMVKKINVVTVGGVIDPGMNIMEIVPLADSLLIQVKCKPSDIAFIHLGAPATVKVTAYDYSTYGSLSGKVTYVSPDTIEEKSPQLNPSQEVSYYHVNIATNKSYFGNEKHKLPIIPGMKASAQIQTGHKRILDYLLKPLVKAKEEALRER